ncbi:kit ligand-like isoform X1 [Dunckerocampus dactyliophorus]|uniref:kit ligand-like isoform X1 n=1 Tax=Dunckerocampus dactyliophorus TaxID=161453 RepID=UPI0024049F29|nr:kit ligand-like isoform X1 [Dunckerocampus dactyliophorus]
MREKIFKAHCVLFLSHLLTSLNLCTGKFGAPITDDVSKLSLLKHNVPSDYEIPVQYIPKEVAGECWVVLNIYPLEQSLRHLASMFGAISSNKDNITVFIAMLKSLRFTFDHGELETAMQVFQCHYEEERLKSALYFDYIEDILRAAREETSSFSCKPPPCLHTQQTPGGRQEGREYRWWKRTPLLLVFIPVTACVTLILWRVKSRRHLPERRAENVQLAAPCYMIPSVSVSIPLQTDANSLPGEDAIPGHESG